MRTQLLGLGLALTCTAGALTAQAGTRVVQPGERVRLVMLGVGQAQGQFIESTADSIIIRTAQQERRSVARSEVRRVGISNGRSGVRGARDGFLAVGATTWVVCSVVLGVAAATEGAREELVYVPLFCLPGAVIFGGVGALFGAVYAAEQWVPAALPAAASPPASGR